MKLIVSAHRATQSEHDNAVATSNLLAAVSGFAMQLVQGMYHGMSEVSVQLEGFNSLRDMLKAGERLCKQFKQDAVYYEVNGLGHLLHADGRHESLGVEVLCQPSMVRSQLFHQTYHSFTQYRNGAAIITERPMRAAA